jgi:site-specific DNA-methyltransferase (adenine-specific)
MKLMKNKPDNFYDLAIVDPPYGIYNKNVSGFMKKRAGANNVKWDNKPDENYFNELFRISKNQIIWGGNYFLEHLGNCPSPLIWDKKNGTNFFSDGEFAWTSFKGTLRFFRHQWCGAFRDSERGEKNFHPTGKPIALYKHCLQNYAKPGQTIFDSHVGSGSIRIACHDLGFDFEGCEMDEDYWKEQKKRYKNHAAQGQLFDIKEIQGLIYDSK